MRLEWCRDGHGMIGWPWKAQNVIPRLVPFADVGGPDPIQEVRTGNQLLHPHFLRSIT